MTFEMWKQILLCDIVDTIDCLCQHMQEGVASNEEVRSWLEGTVAVANGIADVGGWLADTSHSLRSSHGEESECAAQGY